MNDLLLIKTWFTKVLFVRNCTKYETNIKHENTPAVDLSYWFHNAGETINLHPHAQVIPEMVILLL